MAAAAVGSFPLWVGRTGAAGSWGVSLSEGKRERDNSGGFGGVSTRCVFPTSVTMKCPIAAGSFRSVGASAPPS